MIQAKDSWWLLNSMIAIAQIYVRLTQTLTLVCVKGPSGRKVGLVSHDQRGV